MKGILLIGLLASASAFAGSGVINGNFEDQSKYGPYGRHGTIGPGFGYNGNSGCRLVPLEKYRQSCTHFKIDLPMQTGRKYRLAADVKGTTLTGAVIVWEAYRNGKSYQSSWGASHKPLAAGWDHQENVFVVRKPVQPGDVFYAMIYMSYNGKKEEPMATNQVVYLDNLAITEDAPDWYFSLSWPTHHRIDSASARVRVHTAFRGPFLAEGETPAYALALEKDGRVLASKPVTLDENRNCTVDFGRLDAAGPARLVLAMTVGGKDRARREIDVTIGPKYVPKKGEVEILENGVALVDGKPFMPLGFYTFLGKPGKFTDAELEEHLKKLHDAGFNCMIDYSAYLLGGRAKLYYDLCDKYGIRTFPGNFCGDALGAQPPDAKACTNIMQRAKRLIAHPSVLGFYTMDEASEDKIPNLCRVRRALNEAAPGHVTVPCNIFSADAFAEVGDIQSGDAYPIGSQPDLSGMDGCVRYQRSLCPAASWNAPQLYNWANKNSAALKDPELYKKTCREGNENELLSVALLYAAHGTTGFFFYSYFDMFKTPVPGWPEKRWEYAKSIAKTLRSLEPFITSGVKPVQVAHTDAKGAHRIVALTDGAGRYRVLVIGLKKDNEATFTLPAEYGALKSRCGMTEMKDGAYTFRGREFSCDVLE